jgi:hypothetical protein
MEKKSHQSFNRTPGLDYIVEIYQLPAGKHWIQRRKGTLRLWSFFVCAVLPTPGKTFRPDQPKIRPLVKKFGSS